MIKCYWDRIDNDTPRRNCIPDSHSPVISMFGELGADVDHIEVSDADGSPGIYIIEFGSCYSEEYENMKEILSNDVLTHFNSVNITLVLWHPEQPETSFLTHATKRLFDHLVSHPIKHIIVDGNPSRSPHPIIDADSSIRLYFSVHDYNFTVASANECFTPPNEINYAPTKHYISLNGNIRSSKLYTLSELKRRDLLRYGHVSAMNFHRKVEYQHYEKFLLSDFLSGDEIVKRRVGSKRFIVDHLYLSDMLPLQPMTLDFTNDSFNPHEWIHASEKKYISGLSEFYNDAAFGLIVESGVRGNKYVISEKVYFPMCFLRPFIIVGYAGFLKELKNNGFQTFPEIFDESYDDIEDDTERTENVLSQVESICNRPVSEITSLYNRIASKLIHNQRLLFNKAHHRTKLALLLEQIKSSVDD